MNKNKKILSRLLITMLATMSFGVNTNAVGGKVRSSSIATKIKAKTKKAKINDLSNLRKIFEKKLDPKFLTENEKFKKFKRRYLKSTVSLSLSGPAWDEFSKKFEILGTYDYTTNRLGLDYKTTSYGNGSGKEGVVIKCRDRITGNLGAVKCGNITKGATAEGLVNSDRFYEDAKKWWTDSPWVVRRLYQFLDDEYNYTVTDWIEGKTLTKYIEDLKKQPLLEKTKNLAKVIKQFNNMLDDLVKKSCANEDLAWDNIIISNDGVLKLVDTGDHFHAEDRSVAEEKARTHLLNFFDNIAIELFNYYDKRGVYTTLRKNGFTNDDIWAMLEIFGKNEKYIDALIYLDLAKIFYNLELSYNLPKYEDQGNWKYVFASRNEIVLPDARKLAIESLDRMVEHLEQIQR